MSRRSQLRHPSETEDVEACRTPRCAASAGVARGFPSSASNGFSAAGGSVEYTSRLRHQMSEPQTTGRRIHHHAATRA